MIRALIFDYFGVVRTTGIRAAFVAQGGDLSKDEAFVTDVTIAANYGFITDADQQLADKLGITVAEWRKALADMHGNDPILLAFIAEIHSTKLFRTGLLSNAGPDSLKDYFAPGEIEKYFDEAMTSGDTGYAKPEPAFYRLMAEKLGVNPEECIMVDDRKEFCLGAERAGMQAIEYRHYSQFRTDLDAILTKEASQS